MKIRLMEPILTEEICGIKCRNILPFVVHLQPPYRRMGFKEGMYPNAERWAKEVLSLPMSKLIEYIVGRIEEFIRVVRE